MFAITREERGEMASQNGVLLQCGMIGFVCSMLVEAHSEQTCDQIPLTGGELIGPVMSCTDLQVFAHFKISPDAVRKFMFFFCVGSIEMLYFSCVGQCDISQNVLSSHM